MERGVLGLEPGGRRQWEPEAEGPEIEMTQKYIFPAQYQIYCTTKKTHSVNTRTSISNL